jgi:hypothetical protein
MSVDAQPRPQEYDIPRPKDGDAGFPQPLLSVDSELVLLPPPIPSAPQEAHDAYTQHEREVNTERLLTGNEPVRGYDNNDYGIDNRVPKHANGLKPVVDYGTPVGRHQADANQMIHGQRSIYTDQYGNDAEAQGLPGWNREYAEKVKVEHRKRQASLATVDNRLDEQVGWELEADRLQGQEDERLEKFSRSLTWRPRHAVRSLTRAMIRHRKGAR